MRKSVLALVVLAASFAGAAQAAESNFYAGVAGVQSHISTGDLTQNDSTGAKIFGGYNLSPNVAVEGAYGYTDGFRVADTKVTGQNVSVSLVGSYPLGYGFTALGKVGVEYQQLRAAGTTVSGTNPVYGVGVKYDVTKNWAVRAEEEFLTRTADSNVNQSRFSLGVQYGF